MSSYIVSHKDVKRLFPKRDVWSHKGQSGKVLVIGGNVRYSGSPAFVALACIRTGTDLTLVAAPKRAADIIAGFQPDIITEPLNCQHICLKDVDHILELMKWADVMVIGGGLGRNRETYMAINSIIKQACKPMVIDAEAIRAVANDTRIIKSNQIITPHENEFMMLGGVDPSHTKNKRVQQVKSLARKLGTTILLKGRFDVISDGYDIAINNTGNPYMAKGGTGDVLAGICGALLARGAKPIESACAGAYINGMAGKLAAKEYGEGTMASDMLGFIPKVIR